MCAADSAGGGRRISPADTMSDVTQVPGKSPDILETHADGNGGVGPAGLCTLVRKTPVQTQFHHHTRQRSQARATYILHIV